MSSGQVNAEALCIVEEASLRRRLKRSLRATGTKVRFLNSVSDIDDNHPPSLLFLDQKSRKDERLPHLLKVMDREGNIVILGESIADDDFVALMKQCPFNNIIESRQPDENELVVTSVKLITGDIFGLDKYLGWGSEIHSAEVSNYDEKMFAIAEVADFAKQAGARRKTLARIENVTDELLMNAIYDAPAAAEKIGDDHSNLRYETGRGSSRLTKSKPATLNYACDGRFFAVSVVDYYGELRKQSILDSLLRARKSGGAPKQGSSGAGLGIYFILSSVSRYIANIQQGEKTEIICLFDLRQSGKEVSSCTDSLHIFTAAK